MKIAYQKNATKRHSIHVSKQGCDQDFLGEWPFSSCKCIEVKPRDLVRAYFFLGGIAFLGSVFVLVNENKDARMRV